MKLNENLETAKNFLKEKGFSLVFIKNGKVLFSSKESGVNSFIKAIDECGEILRNSFLADKVVGLAIAMLSVYIGISGVYACVISKSGVDFLKKNKIFLIYEKEVEKILNRDKREICPFEKIAIESKTIEEVYLKIKKFLESSQF